MSVEVVATAERVALRRWFAEDAPTLFELTSQADVARYLGWSPSSAGDALAMINDLNGREAGLGVTTWAVVETASDAVIGWCGYARTNAPWLSAAVVEIGWMLGRDHWGEGFATEAATAALSVGARRLEAGRIISKCDVANTRSERVMQRLGLRRVGVVGAERPTVVYRFPASR